MTAAGGSSQGLQAATLVLVSLGAATMIAHAFTGAGFGFFGDELQVLDDSLTDVSESEFFFGIRRIYANAPDQSNVPIFFQREQREKIGGVRVGTRFDGSGRANVVYQISP